MENPPANPKANKRIPIQDILHYKAKGLSVNEIARMTGCTHSNISQRLASIDTDSLNNFMTYKDRVMESLQMEAFTSITSDELKKVSVPQRVWIGSVLEDKIRIIRGQATDIQDVRVLSVDLDKAVKRLREARLQEGVEG